MGKVQSSEGEGETLGPLMIEDIGTHIANFQEWLKTDTGDAASWQKERKKRLTWYREHLSKDMIGKLTGEEFATLIKDLWATNIWKNKDYKVAQLLNENGLDNIRISLGTLLHGADPMEKRWDEFKASIKGLGPSSMSEILTFSDPHMHALVNKKPFEVLPRIGLTLKPVSDGNSYKQATEQIGKVKGELEKHGVKDVDFILTDFFIAYLFYQVFELQYKRKEEQRPPQTEIKSAKPLVPALVTENFAIDSHEAAQAVLLYVGQAPRLRHVHSRSEQGVQGPKARRRRHTVGAPVLCDREGHGLRQAY